MTRSELTNRHNVSTILPYFISWLFIQSFKRNNEQRMVTLNNARHFILINALGDKICWAVVATQLYSIPVNKILHAVVSVKDEKKYNYRSTLNSVSQVPGCCKSMVKGLCMVAKLCQWSSMNRNARWMLGKQKDHRGLNYTVPHNLYSLAEEASYWK